MIMVVLPFSMDALQSAVRRYLARPGLSIEAVIPQRLPGVSAYQLNVQYSNDQRGSEAGDSGNRVLSLLFRSGKGTNSALASSAHHMLLTPDDLVGEPTRPLIGTADTCLSEVHEHLRDDHPGEWVLIDGPVWGRLVPGARWSAEQYLEALGSLARQHSAWWGRPLSHREHPLFAQGHAGLEVREALVALEEISSAPWGSRFLSEGQIRAWRDVLERPDCLLGTLMAMPQTLIQWDCHGSDVHEVGTSSFQALSAGPAAYDFACLYTAARWYYGRLPMSLAQMRRYYLEQLNAHIGEAVDRYVFDMAVDAARAWRFAILWPGFIAERHLALGALLHHLRATVIEPAFASLQRAV